MNKIFKIGKNEICLTFDCQADYCFGKIEAFTNSESKIALFIGDLWDGISNIDSKHNYIVCPVCGAKYLLVSNDDKDFYWLEPFSLFCLQELEVS